MRMNVERNQKMRRTRFTLIELLVVVAILAILAGLLIPALNKARVRTLTVSCLSNVKQQGVCAAMYSQDFEDYIPAHFTGGSCRNALSFFFQNKSDKSSIETPFYNFEIHVFEIYIPQLASCMPTWIKKQTKAIKDPDSNYFFQRESKR